MPATPFKVGEQSAEGERTSRRRRLNDVKARDAIVDAEFYGVAPVSEGRGVGDFGYVGAEGGGHVGRWTKLLETGNREGWELVAEITICRNTRNV